MAIRIIFRKAIIQITDEATGETRLIPKDKWDMWEIVNKKLKEYFNHGKKKNLHR